MAAVTGERGRTRMVEGTIDDVYHRSALFSAGTMTALDIRNETARALGTGGLLQVSMYHTGLSGGSWLASSLVLNDFPTVRELVLVNGRDLSGWLLSLDLLLPDALRATDFYECVSWQVKLTQC